MIDLEGHQITLVHPHERGPRREGVVEFVLVVDLDEDELGHALAAGAALVGVNQRDLVTFEVDHERALRMATVMPAGVLAVAESGVRGHDDAAALAGAGYSAVLVGESLVTSGDPAAAVREMRRR